MHAISYTKNWPASFWICQINKGYRAKKNTVNKLDAIHTENTKTYFGMTNSWDKTSQKKLLWKLRNDTLKRNMIWKKKQISYLGSRAYTPRVSHGTWKWWFPRGISSSRGRFSGSICSMLNFTGNLKWTSFDPRYLSLEILDSSLHPVQGKTCADGSRKTPYYLGSSLIPPLINRESF